MRVIPRDDGDAGQDGKDGTNGANGASGADGKDGKDGKDGIGIAKAEINADGELVLTYTDGTDGSISARSSARTVRTA